MKKQFGTDGVRGEANRKLTPQLAFAIGMGEAIANYNDAFFIGRSLDYVVALEGALKLKEISYIHGQSQSGRKRR